MDLKDIKSPPKQLVTTDEDTLRNDRNLEKDGYNPLVPQVAGDHYKNRGIQPIEYSARNELSFCQGNVIKYITRYKDKNGIEDLAKVVHYTLLETYFQYGIEGSTELKDRILEILGEKAE